MSQYPQNYQSPPPIGYMQPLPPPDPRAPARRAGTLMIILGSLGLVCGVCFGAMSLLPFEQIMAQSGQRPPLPPGMSMSMFVTVMKITAALVLVGSTAELLLGVGVRKGGSGAIISALVFSVLATGYFLLNAVGSVVMGGGNPFASLVMGFVLIGIFVTQIVLLVRAKQASAYLQRAGAEYQAQYGQYLQQQQLYQQPPPATTFQTAPPPPPPGYPGALGYGQSAYNAPPAAGGTLGGAATGWQWPATQPPPPPPPAAPPSAAAPPEQSGDAQNGEGSPPHI